MRAARNAPRLERERDPEIDVLAVWQRVIIAADVLHSWRHDSRHEEGSSGKREGPADNPGVGAEELLPCAMAQNERRNGLPLFVIDGERTAQNRLVAEQAEETCRHAHAGEALGT